MLEHLETLLLKECALDKARPLLVGVSGGPDSLCLLGVLHQAGFSLIVGHFNHLLRAEAQAEASAVEAMAARLAVPFVTASGDVQAYAQDHGLSLEEAGRTLRYQFLFAQARALGAQAVAVGHTADDQVETVLMHLIRGAGLAGLKGMAYRTVLPAFDPELPLVRPLLDTWRRETLAYCAAHGWQAQRDPSNDSLDFLRNRLRSLLIPTLETYNPKFREALRRTAHTLASDYELLEVLLEGEWRRSLLARQGAYIQLDLAYLREQPQAVQKHLIQRASGVLAPRTQVTFATLERAAAFLSEAARTRLELAGGLVLVREGDVLYLAKAEAALPFDHWPQLPPAQDAMPVSVPCQAQLTAGWEFTAEVAGPGSGAWDRSEENQDPFEVWLDAERLPGKLEVRVRREGDVFAPLGLGGHTQKLSDFFTNEKLPQRARARWPLLASGAEILWVPGYRPAETCKLQKGSRSAAHLSLRAPARSI